MEKCTFKFNFLKSKVTRGEQIYSLEHVLEHLLHYRAIFLLFLSRFILIGRLIIPDSTYKCTKCLL